VAIKEEIKKMFHGYNVFYKKNMGGVVPVFLSSALENGVGVG